MIQTTLKNPIQWKPTNLHQEVEKLMYQDGFHITKKHGLWKLKTRLTTEEWDKIKHLFQYYTKNTKIVKNMKYYGWATTKPVQVIQTLKGGKQ